MADRPRRGALRVPRRRSARPRPRRLPGRSATTCCCRAPARSPSADARLAPRRRPRRRPRRWCPSDGPPARPYAEFLDRAGSRRRASSPRRPTCPGVTARPSSTRRSADRPARRARRGGQRRRRPVLPPAAASSARARSSTRQLLAALAPGCDPAAVRPQLAGDRADRGGRPRPGARSPRFAASERFHWLVAPSSTIVQPGPVHTGLTGDPPASSTASSPRWWSADACDVIMRPIRPLDSTAQDALLDVPDLRAADLLRQRGDLSAVRDAAPSPRVRSSGRARRVTRPDGEVRAKLAMACRELDADAALLSEIRDGRELRALGRPARTATWALSIPLSDTICERLLDGRIGSIVADTTAEPSLRDAAGGPRGRDRRLHRRLVRDRGRPRVRALLPRARDAAGPRGRRRALPAGPRGEPPVPARALRLTPLPLACASLLAATGCGRGVGAAAETAGGRLVRR